MKVVILCGGLGTRLREETEFRPKPMVEVGGRPILWHIMKTYAHYGHRDFVLCLGYRGNTIKEYFLNYEAMNNDFSIRLGDKSHIQYHGSHAEQEFGVTLADTGLNSMTGGRIKRIRRYIDDDTFLMTYGDGLIDVRIDETVKFHHSHGRIATMTAVPPISRFGLIDAAPDHSVTSFVEKPKTEGLMNAGYFVLNRRVFDYLGGDECIFEQEPLQRLALDGELMAYRHDGFFYAMDTFREYQHLNELWGRDAAPLEGLGVSAFWQDRPVLVTGATGLVGAWLTRRLLDAGADVVCLIRDWVPQSELVRAGTLDRVKVVRGDVRDLGVLERTIGEYETGTVIHLAAQTIVGIANRNPLSTFESNIQGTWNLLEACRRAPLVKSIVIASSDKAYGDQDRLPYSEDAPLQGRHPYDVSKSCADLISQTYAKSYGLPVAVTRCGNFYGGGDLNWNRIVPGTIRSILRGERPVIRSDGHFIRDYFYVEDGAAAYMLLAELLHERPELCGAAFNFSNEIQVTALELVQRILHAMGSPLEPDVRNQAVNEIRHQYLTAERAKKLLDWSPLFTLEQGLERTIAWYREFLRDAA